jgi:hypothetical protein
MESTEGRILRLERQLDQARADLERQRQWILELQRKRASIDVPQQIGLGSAFGPPGQPQDDIFGPFPAFLPATAIVAKAGNIPGSGIITFASWDGTNLTPSTVTATAYNHWKTPTPADNTKMCDVYLWQNVWWIGPFDC